MRTLLIALTTLLSWPLWAACQEPAPTGESLAERGYRLLTTKTYLTPDFDQSAFDEVWKTWEEPLRSQAAAASLDERRRMAFSRYGLTPHPPRGPHIPREYEGPVAWQYVDDGQGNWTMNCLACHGGKVAGKVIPGAPNSLYALETLSEEIRTTKLRMEKPLSRMDTGSVFIPLGTTNGTTNAVMFGVVLLAKRDGDLNLVLDRPTPAMTHHDHDAPAWWNLKKKKHLYIDGFAAKGHRPLMQFLLVPQNGPQKFREWEEDYRAIEAWIESLEAPKYPYEIDAPLAKQGEAVFNHSCARCHGTYGERETYPEKLVPIAEIGTDRVRLDALTVEGRQHYHESWFADNGKKETVVDPGGYVAPPLDGVWASAPYFHNGAVPTLWHVLHPSERPVVWNRTEDGYDREKVGLEIAAFDKLPPEAKSAAARRRHFDTRRPGKSAAGHEFPNELNEHEKRAVLEYLKSL